MRKQNTQNTQIQNTKNTNRNNTKYKYKIQIYTNIHKKQKGTKYNHTKI